MVTRFRKERPLPARFTEQDRLDLRGVIDWAYNQCGYDLREMGGIHYTDFAQDTVLHQLMPHRSDGEIVSWCCDLDVQPIDSTEVARDAERLAEQEAEIERRRALFLQARELRGGSDVAHDVLVAYYKHDDPDHEWAMSVATLRAKELADERGIIR